MKVNRRSVALLLALCVATLSGQKPTQKPYTTWSEYGGSADSSQYSALRQITKSNVKKLEQAWFYPIAAPNPRNPSGLPFAPIVAGNMMYVLKPGGIFVALNAENGKEIWTRQLQGALPSRGVNYWQSKDGKDRRLIFAANSFLQELNADTGAPITTFGVNGLVDLREGLGRDASKLPNVQSATPGHVFENMIIPAIAPGEDFGSPPGYIRAYDVLTGKLLWTFHTVPQPGEFGYETWPPNAWKWVGGTNQWGESAIDEKRAIGYFTLGSPTTDFYGGDRTGQGLFGNCIIAIDLRTGKRLWHFQQVHHDTWDYDPTTAPKLVTVKYEGKTVDVVAHPGKTGFLYVFDRVTGVPLWPIEERPVAPSKIPGEVSWPTQPFPTKPPPFARQSFTVNDINPYLEESEKERVRQVLMQADTSGLFAPTSLEHDTLQTPGDDGGANFGNAAADPAAGLVFVRSADSPNVKRMRVLPGLPQITNGTPEQFGAVAYIQNCFGCHGPDRNGVGNPRDIGVEEFKTIVSKGKGPMPAFAHLNAKQLDDLAAYIASPAAGATGALAEVKPVLAIPSDRVPWPDGVPRYFGSYQGWVKDSKNLPGVAPPWQTLTAYDLNKGEIKWQVPLGTVPFLVEKGIKNTGAVKIGLSSNHIAPVATAGGLVFIGSWADRTLRAFDRDSGKTLWEKEIEANPEGMPAVYEVAGRQYVAFPATGRIVPPGATGANGGEGVTWRAGKPEAQGIYVFALPGKN